MSKKELAPAEDQYYLPEQGVGVTASDAQEAVQKAQAEVKDKENNDDDKL